MTALAPPPQLRATRAGTARRVAAPAGLALAAGLGVIAVYAVFVRTELGQRVDEMAMQGAQVDHARLATLLDSTLDGTSLLSLAAVALLAAAIGLLRRRMDLAVAAGVIVLGANLTTQLLKSQLDRPRLYDTLAPNSLPSGHTTAAASVAFVLVLVLPHAVRALLALAGTAYVAVIAVATVWAAWHRPSDVVAALLVVLAWGAMVVAVIRARRGGRADGARGPSRLASMPLGVAALAGGALAALGLAGLAMAVMVGPSSAFRTVAFLTGAAGMCAAAAAVFLIWVRLVSGDARVRPVEEVAPADG